MLVAIMIKEMSSVLFTRLILFREHRRFNRLIIRLTSSSCPIGYYHCKETVFPLMRILTGLGALLQRGVTPFTLCFAANGHVCSEFMQYTVPTAPFIRV